MRTPTWLGYGTLVAACLFAFRILFVWMTYRYFWVNAWAEVLVFAVILVAHLIARPRADPQFRKVTRRIVLATLLGMGAFLVVAFNLRIG